MSFESVDQFLLAAQDTNLWELFHENSKTARHDRHPTFVRWPSDHVIVQVMKRLRRVKPYTDRPKIDLSHVAAAVGRTLDEVMQQRETARSFSGGSIHLGELARILFMSYGVTRDNQGTNYPRPFRMIPSGGALYPLELYVHATRVEGLAPGLYHYDAEDLSLDTLHLGDDSAALSASFIQSELVRTCAAVCFITAIFIRSTFKYGNRGYRFVFLEAGHLAQNALLTAQELDVAAAPIGGYMDREIDQYLGIDGLNESTVYTLLMGRSSL